MRTKIAVFLAFLLLLSGTPLGDAIEVYADLDFGAEEEASPIQDPDVALRPNHSGAFRSRQGRNKPALKSPGDLHGRLGYFHSAGGIKKPSLLVEFPQQELYRLLEVYRL